MTQPQQPPVVRPMPSVLMGRMEQAAIQRQYVGTLSDSDAKALVSRSYNTTKDEAAAVDRVVGSPLTWYISHGDFARHAIWELLQVYEQAGFPDDYIPDVISHVRAMREAAQRLRIRQQFQDVITIYEASLTEGLDTGDFDLVEATLDTLGGYIDRTPDEHWKNYVRRVILRSGIVKAGVEALHAAVEGGTPGTRQYAKVAEFWTLWLEGIAE